MEQQSQECSYMNLAAAIVIAGGLIVAAFIGYKAAGQFAPVPTPIVTMTVQYPEGKDMVVLDKDSYDWLQVKSIDGNNCRRDNPKWDKENPSPAKESPENSTYNTTNYLITK